MPGYDDDDHFRHLKKADTHLQGETESRDWLKSTPKVYGADRVPRGMGTTSAKRPQPKQKEPPDAA
jgi:hypothetical protein